MAEIILDVKTENIVGLHTARMICLNNDALHAAAVRKVIDIGRPEIGRNGLVDISKRHAQCRCLLAINDEFGLWRRRQPLDIRHPAAIGLTFAAARS